MKDVGKDMHNKWGTKNESDLGYLINEIELI